MCGNYGCLQVYAGLNEVIRTAPETGGPKSLSGLLTASQAGDPAVLDFLAETGHRVGRAVGGVVNLLGIGTIIVSGQTMSLWEYLDDGFRRGLDESVLKFLLPLDITVKSWTESEHAVGGAGLALHNAISLNVPLLHPGDAVDRV